MIPLKKKNCSKSVQRKYIWDLHLKVYYKVIYTFPHPIHILSLQVDFIQTQTFKTKRENGITSNIHLKKCYSYCTSTADPSPFFF